MITISYFTLALIIYISIYVGNKLNRFTSKNNTNKKDSSIQEIRQCELIFMLITNCLDGLTLIKRNSKQAYESEHPLRSLIINPSIISSNAIDATDIPFLDFLSSTNTDVRNPFLLKTLILKYNDVVSQWQLLKSKHIELSPILAKCYTSNLSIDIDSVKLTPDEYRTIYNYVIEIENLLAQIDSITHELYKLFNKLPSAINNHFGKHVFGEVQSSIENEKYINLKYAPLTESSINYLTTLLSKSVA